MLRGLLKKLRKPFPRNTKELGAWGEDQAARHLRRKGYDIMGRNLRMGPYEVDILARKGDTVVFVEVKTRRDDSLVSPDYNVDATKQAHLRGAAKYYLSQQMDPEKYYRFDVIAIVVDERTRPDITHFENAFPYA